MNRTAMIRNIVGIAGGTNPRIYCSGPKACFGKKGEVSYTVMCAGLDDEKKALIAKNLPMIYPGVFKKVYVTKRNNVGWRVGGNLKVVFATRADGTPA